MKRNTLEKLRDCLRDLRAARGTDSDDDRAPRAVPLERMLAVQVNAMRRMAPLVDTFGRLHDNLRISVTDRCNIRCFYCMPEDGVEFVPRAEILTFEEIERFVRVAARLGVTQSCASPAASRWSAEICRDLIRAAVRPSRASRTSR